ncbi:hypothetical protein L210DRAFT_986286 [Boletus edulis BED1]|uniref:Uncharacterized protein n=1 Tax=Boletus edulis BED1 TaxID=1328754 RepID=A0AAD4GGZ2_BOLED|nr:hypothetical protein L210DRAFT_986286 [Boletus edulis BED1]
MGNLFAPTPRLLYFAPRFGKLCGPIDDTGALHSCFAARAMDMFFTDNKREASRNPSCFPTCTTSITQSQALELDDDDFDILINEPISALLFQPRNSALCPRPLHSSYFNNRDDPITEDLPSRNRVPDASTLRVTANRAWLSQVQTSEAETVENLMLNETTYTTILEWRDYLQEVIASEPDNNRHGGPPIFSWRAEGESVEVLARLLTNFVYAKFSNGPVNMFSFPDGTKLGISSAGDSSELMLQSLFRNVRLYKVGQGIGEGVERAVIVEAVKTMFTDRTLWTTTIDHFMSINILSLADNPKLECRLCTYGFLCALYIIGAHDLLFDLALIQSLAPIVGKDLSVIPTDHSTPLDRTHYGPMDALLSQLPVEMSMDEHAVLKSQLYTGALLGSGCRWALLSGPPKELTAFVKDFDVFISEALPSFAQTLRPSAKTLIMEMYSLRITSPAELISRIEWEFSPRSVISLDDCDVEMAFTI